MCCNILIIANILKAFNITIGRGISVPDPVREVVDIINAT